MPKNIFYPVQALAKSTSLVIRNVSLSGHSYFKYYHHLCKIQCPVASGAPGGTAPRWIQHDCLQNILGHCSAWTLPETAHKDPGKAGEKG